MALLIFVLLGALFVLTLGSTSAWEPLADFFAPFGWIRFILAPVIVIMLLAGRIPTWAVLLVAAVIGLAYAVLSTGIGLW